ncbi:MAG: DNA translocase FtsK 4TM domain-containing protein, partial [Geminicoccaceae bacterium]|nr:DNA translocase FtsK 4TM domain-containing protein [Geminicoccaceae bacterium]
TDPSLNRAAPGPASNPLGSFGAILADLGLQTIGLAIWLVVLILPFWGVRLILGRPMQWFWIALTALPVALLAAAAYLATLEIPETWPYWVGLGGFVGDFLLHRLERLVGDAAYVAGSAGLAVLAVLLALGITWREAWHGTSRLVALPFRGRAKGPSQPIPRPR